MSLVPGGGAACVAADARVLRGGSARRTVPAARTNATARQTKIRFIVHPFGPRSKVQGPMSKDLLVALFSDFDFGLWTLDLGLFFHAVPRQRFAADDRA